VKEYPNAQAPEVLSAPVHFPGGKAADVFPWTGNNPEDTLTEALVKVGISNKPQIMNETNTARPSLWSNLKNKSGLTTLSTLFVAVLEKRQQTGRLQEPNTFKPPPRLTLRDTAREQWLYDLSNPAVGLRRLSRTIPHGLTGKVLLEQCLNKNIPLPRALWLARCVGINELRAHKRKGQAGTVTWVRGWTSSVEQFLDSILSGIGTGEWKQRITYSWVTIAPGDN
jgi:mediator of RNA polymerase II transcription subunit 12